MVAKTKESGIDKDLEEQIERAKRAGKQRLASPEVEIGEFGNSRTQLAYRCLKEAGYDSKEYIPRWGNPRVANGYIQQGCIPVVDPTTRDQVRYGDSGILFVEPRELYRRRIAAAEREGNRHQEDNSETESRSSAVSKHGAGIDVRTTKTSVKATDLAASAASVVDSD